MDTRCRRDDRTTGHRAFWRRGCVSLAGRARILAPLGLYCRALGPAGLVLCDLEGRAMGNSRPVLRLRLFVGARSAHVLVEAGMKDTEIVRRLRALIALPPKDRPISINKLELVAGVSDNEVYEVARVGRMQEKTRLRLSRALTLVENDQVVVKRGKGHSFPHTPPTVTVRAPQPQQRNVQRVTFTSQGPKVEFVAKNPRAFADLRPPPEKSKRR